MKITVHNQEGKEIKKMELSPAVFGIKPKKEVIHQVAMAQLTHQRRPWAHTKTRGEVRGGGRKPWRQKGTGRARVGSIRSPIWRGGGITFGPRSQRNFKQKINKKVRRLAFLMCLSDKVKNGKLYLLNKLEIPEIKTKYFTEIIKKILPRASAKGGKIIFALAKKDDKLIKSSRNISNIKPVLVSNLNVIDLLENEYLLMTMEGIKKLEKRVVFVKK